MKQNSLFPILICSAFLTAQAAVDAGRDPVRNQMPSMNNLREQIYVPNSLDVQLKERVQQHLRSSLRNYDPNKVTILSQNGEVTLKGVVKTAEEAQEMEREVLRVNGVSRVNNNLVLNIVNK